MHNAHDQRPQQLVERAPSNVAVQAEERILIEVMRVIIRIVMVGMCMDESTVTMRVRVTRPYAACDGRYSIRETRQIPATEHDQHQADGKLHGQSQPNWNHDVEKDNGAAYEKDGKRMTESPEDADQRGTFSAPLLTDDRRHGNHVIGVGGVPHPQEKSNRDNGNQANHAVEYWMPTPS